MIIPGDGDLLKADVDALVNTVNTVGVMGKGIALQFKRAFPENFRAYEAACKKRSLDVGSMFVVESATLDGPRWIVNFPTKRHWKGKSQLAWISSGLDDLVIQIKRIGIRSIAIPPLGAGNGGLDWRDVRPLIVAKLGAIDGLTVHLFEPADAHRSIVGRPIRMTWGRAVLVRLLEEYVKSRAVTEPWSAADGASALEIQKLMYFANLAQPTLRLRFNQGKYGPYSDQVRHLMQEMEGSFLTGFGDGATRILDLEPVSPTEDGRRKSRDVDAKEDGRLTSEIVGPTLDAVRGFEGVYGMELLATVHWVRTHEDIPDTPPAVTEQVRKWSERKGRLFTESHVASAMVQLDALTMA